MNSAMTIPIDHFVRSRRRTIALIVEQDGSLTVRAPLHMSEASIREFVESHARWIHRKQVRAKATPLPSRKDFVDGESFFFLGREYPLRIVAHQRPGLILKDGEFHLSAAALPKASETFVRWYKTQALAVITPLVERRASQNELAYQKIRVTSARTRWGSCSSSGTLSFTWRLVLAPLEVIDYVVVHELVHTKIKNHSSRFWRGVMQIVPQYKIHVQWLKNNGPSISSDP